MQLTQILKFFLIIFEIDIISSFSWPIYVMYMCLSKDNFGTKYKLKHMGLEHSLVAEYFPSLHEVLGSIPSTIKRNTKK